MGQRAPADRIVVAHLLRRATFGPTAAEVDAAQAAGPAATLAGLLHPAQPDPGAVATPVPEFDTSAYVRLGPDATQEQRQRANQLRREHNQALLGWWLSRMVLATHQLTEKMVFFWHGHWATSIEKVRFAPLMLAQLETLRRWGRGDFLVLAQAMLRDPAMIVWLDGQRNTRRAPNENLARELMELFVLGIGAYTEQDIKEGARALTGWVIDRASGVARLEPVRHDGGVKTILGTSANFDADSYARLLVDAEAHPAFLAQRLWSRFGSAQLPEATRTRLVAAYGSGRDVDAMMAALFDDDAFAATAGQQVKQPVEWLVGAMRQLGLRPDQLDSQRRQGLYASLNGLGQVPLRPPSVGGWPAGAAWLTTSSLQVRLRSAAGLAAAAGAEVLAPLTAGAVGDRLAALARLLVVDSWTQRTREVLVDATADARALLAVALASPEYSVT